MVAVIALSIARWFTTRYRITPTQVELRTGLLTRRTKVAPADRVRTVDVTAPVLHRLLGLAKVDIGTGGGGHHGDTLVLDALAAGPAGSLRAELLHRSRNARGCGASCRDAGSDGHRDGRRHDASVPEAPTVPERSGRRRHTTSHAGRADRLVPR